jgi:hypothetical protein
MTRAADAASHPFSRTFNHLAVSGRAQSKRWTGFRERFALRHLGGGRAKGDSDA